jgi:hypothetical protein
MKTEADRIARDRRSGLNDPPWQIINRSIHCRGERQTLALAHLKQRGLWLSAAQRKQAELED